VCCESNETFWLNSETNDGVTAADMKLKTGWQDIWSKRYICMKGKCACTMMTVVRIKKLLFCGHNQFLGNRGTFHYCRFMGYWFQNGQLTNCCFAFSLARPLFCTNLGQLNSPKNDWARELFKPSKDAQSFVMSMKNGGGSRNFLPTASDTGSQHQEQFFQRFLGTRFEFLELKIGSLESEISGPYMSIPGT